MESAKKDAQEQIISAVVKNLADIGAKNNDVLPHSCI